MCWWWVILTCHHRGAWTGSTPLPSGLLASDDFALTDVWRHFHPSDMEFICHSATYCTFSRIDLAYASSWALQWVTADNILARGASGHAPLLVTMQLAEPGGPVIWRLSRFWLMDQKIQESIPEALCGFKLLNEDTTRPLLVWDAFKSWLRGEYIS